MSEPIERYPYPPTARILHDMRIERGLTDEEAAKAIGIDYDLYFCFEIGALTPSKAMRDRFSEYYKSPDMWDGILDEVSICRKY